MTFGAFRKHQNKGLNIAEETEMKLLIATTKLATILLAAHPFSAALAQGPASGGAIKDRQISLSIGIPDSIEFHGGIGVNAGVVADYEGSDDFAVAVLPLVDIRQPGFLFLKGASVNPNDGLASLGWNAINFGYSKGSEQKLRLSVGPIVRYRGGRDEGHNDALKGLGDIDGGVGLGGFLEASAGPWSGDVTVAPQEAGNGHDGLLAAFGAKYTATASDRLTVSVGLSASWADDDYMQGFFGVTSAQAARSGLPRFDGDAGFKDAGIQIGASYAMSENWSIDGQVGYQRLLNDAADSPIVERKGSSDQFRALVGVAYRF